MNKLFQNHIPYRLIVNEGQPEVLWLHTSGVSFDAPFFDETILRCMSLTPGMARFKCVSSVETMIEAAWDVDVVTVTAFLFHVSRCGSTLLSQSLVLSAENIVLSEVPFFDALLRHDFRDPDLKKRALEAAVRLYGQKRSETSNKLFIKLDSWSVYYQELLRALWPGTPFLLLYRNPLEVLQSHQKMAGMHAVPGLLEPWLFDISSESIYGKDRDTYLGEVLAYYARQFESMFLTDQNSWLLSYHDGIENMIQTLFSAIGLQMDSDFLTKTAERSRFHSKDPGKVFSETLAVRPIPEALRDAYAGFEKLEVLKNKGR
jgi:hypothetical protein